MKDTASHGAWARFRPFGLAVMVALLISERVFDLSGGLGDVLTVVYVMLVVATLATYAYDWRGRLKR